MAQRKVKTAGAAMSRTTRPVAADGLENVVAGLGTNRDKMSFTSYEFVAPLTRYELENMYRSSWLSKRIVNAVADDMTREWRSINFDDPKNKAQFVIEQAEKRLGVKAKINKALRWSRLYGGGLVIIGLRNANDLSKPLDPATVKKGDLKYLHVMDRWRVAPEGELVTDMSSPHFGKPKYYLLAESSVRVHHTRVLRFNGEELPYFAWLQNGMWDDSSLQHVYESLRNADTSTRAIASMLFEANVDVVKVADLADLLARKNGEQILTKRFQVAALLKSFNRMLLLGENETYEKKSNNFANLHEVMRGFRIDVCGAANIPMTILFGQSASGLSSTGDEEVRNYYDMVSAKQEAELRPQLEQLDEVMVRSELGTMPDDYRYEFNSLWQINDTDQSEIDLNRAQADKIYVDMGAVPPQTVARDLKERGTYKSLTDADIAKVDDKPRPAAAPGASGDQPPAGGQEDNGEPDNQDQDGQQ
jgi:phage-related protein (TIGR01555 family)